jgi:cytochrome b6
MVLSIILHIFRIYLTGGFKKPRELIWITGSLLAAITVSFGVTGYSLPWDQIGYWASKIVTAVPEILNLIYPNIRFLIVLILRGASAIGQITLTRFYIVHTFLLPFITLTLMLIHFIMLRKQGISGPL